MSFRGELRNRGLSYVLDRPEFKSVHFIGSDKVYKFLDDILENNRKVLLYGDYDADGVSCVSIWKEFFNKLKYKNFDVFKYRSRMHTIDPMVLNYAVYDSYDYVLINDTGTNELDKLKVLSDNNIKTIVFDHHNAHSDYSVYDANCALVSSVIENKILGEVRYTVSAGALTFLVLDYYLDKKGISSDSMAYYALCSLYADSIDMSNTLNRSIYYKVRKAPLAVPVYIKDFMTYSNSIYRRFIEYTWSPRINCLFRAERFDILNNYMMSNYVCSNGMNDSKVANIKNIHLDYSNMVRYISDVAEVKELNNFVLCNLDSVRNYIDFNEKKVYNYTGLIGNKLVEKYNKPAIVYCSHFGNIRGSFRDMCNRNYLQLFNKIGYAEGHPGAFGIKVDGNMYSDWLESINLIDKYYSLPKPEVTDIIHYMPKIKDDYKTFKSMANYNEFSGKRIPTAYIEMRFDKVPPLLTGPFSRTKSKTLTYKLGTTLIESSRALIKDSVYRLKPVDGDKLKLYVI